MKFNEKTVMQPKEILANDHYVAIAYDCSALAATDGVIKAGTIVPKNDDTAVGVLLYDVNVNENPNGAVVIHGFVKKDKLLVLFTARKFRGIYNEVAGLTDENNRINVREFEMPLQKYVGCKYCYFKVLFSRTELPLYLVMIVGLVISYLYLR